MSKTINTTAIHAAVTAALQAAGKYGARVNELKTLLAGVPRNEAQDIITPAVAKQHGVKVKVGKRGLSFEGGRAKGEKSGTPEYEAAKRDRSRLLAHIYGKAESAHAAPAVQRFNRAKVEAIQQCIAGMSKAEAKAYFAKALEAAFA